MSRSEKILSISILLIRVFLIVLRVNSKFEREKIHPEIIPSMDEAKEQKTDNITERRAKDANRQETSEKM